jgi:hypothetical protein
MYIQKISEKSIELSTPMLTFLYAFPQPLTFYNLVLAESFTRIFRLHLYPAVQALSYSARASDFATMQRLTQILPCSSTTHLLDW